jgi:ribosome-associated protein
MIEVTPEVTISEAELTFMASRSGGPGGQNVNKVATRVTLRFDVVDSPSLSPDQKSRILERLATRISKGRVLQVVSQRHRTQAANRRAALERFVELLRRALAEEALRVPTRPGRAAAEHRVASKKRRGRLKRQRSLPPSADE